MKCVICSTEIDEAQKFPLIEGPAGRPAEDLTSKLKLTRELEKWICVTITAQVHGGCKTIRSGHLCPAHSVDNLSFSLDLPIVVTKPQTAAAPAPALPKPLMKGKQS